MKIEVLFFIFVASMSSYTHGLRCWTCNNARGDHDCMRRGKLVTCNANEQSCFTEIRNDIGYWRVRKRCKQPLACDNNKIQNLRAASINSQCNPFLRSSVCRCCCDQDQCNRRGLFCRESLNLKQCAKLPKLWKGWTTCDYKNKDTELGTVCKFTCEKGLHLIGASISTCKKTSPGARPAFDNPPPKCKKMECFEREDLPNGDISCTNGNKISSICEYTCKSGYKMFGQPSAQCEPSLKWSQLPPLCAIVTCNGQQAPFNGRMQCSSEDSLIGTTCQFFCDKGSELVGSQENVCIDVGERYGKWNIPPPICQKMKCLPISSAPLNGSVSCSDSNIYDSVCSYSCDRGFTVVGSTERKCQLTEDATNTTWSDPEPICERITCSPVGHGPQHGSVSCSDYNFLRSVCLFKCDNDVVIKGEIIRHCQLAENGIEGVWSNPQPTCGSSGSRTSVCHPVNSSPQNGSVICTNSNLVGSICSYECGSEYGISGNRTRTCELDVNGVAQWSDLEPTCERLTCPSVISGPQDGSVTCSDSNFLGSVCLYNCNLEYLIEGNSSRTCQLIDDGKAEWSHHKPTCQRITCLPISINPSHGSVSCSNENFITSICTYECDSEFIINGNENRTCQLNKDGEGEWSHQQPTCQKMKCDETITSPDDGSVICTNSNFIGSICSYKCNNEYQINGNENRQCQLIKDGIADWNNPQPICERVTCLPDSSNPLNGGVNCTDSNFYASVCTYTCDNGFEISGSKTRSCELDENGVGIWNNFPPMCKRITCDDISLDPTNGSVSCSDKNFVGSICTYECDSEFIINGNENRTCQLNKDGEGEWSHLEPICEKMRCDETTTSPDDGSVICTNSNFIGSICSYKCNNEYKINGNENRQCQLIEDGIADWNNPQPICERMSCPPVNTDPADGSVFCSDSSFVGSICFYKCHSGYAISGDRGADSGSRICQQSQSDDDAVWNKPEPSCEKITCLPPSSVPTGGSVTCTNLNNIGSRCTYKCDSEYRMKGEESRRCQLAEDGFAIWSQPEPDCERITCLPISINPSHGSVSCSNENFITSICTYECDSEFIINGNENRTCQLNKDGEGEWSHQQPTCQSVTCPPLNTSIIDGSVSCSDINNLHSTCWFRCHSGYTINGDETRKCEIDEDGVAKWSNIQPTCQKIRCLPVSSEPTDGSVSCTDSNFAGSICSYECNSEFDIIGNQSRRCQLTEDGSSVWNSPEPTCERKRCSPDYRGVSSNVAANCTSNNFIGSICTFSCDTGYFIEGSIDTKCIMEDDQVVWSDDAPICLEVTCLPEMTIFDNGQMECTNNNKYSSECRFICNEGYTIFGSNITTCLHDKLGGPIGVWTPQLPFCILPPSDLADSFNNSSDFPQTRKRNSTSCFPEYNYIENGEAMCTDGNQLESECIWMCNEGYELVGYQETLCLYDEVQEEGHWTFDEPKCVAASCGRIDNFRHGEFYCSDDNQFMSVCNFTCDLSDGYHLYPAEIIEIECITDVDGVVRWNPPKPCCSRPCPPYTYMDLVIVLDSSSSVKQHNWDIQKSFTRMLIELFHIGEDASRMSVLRYNSYVDEESEIKLNDVIDGDMERLLSMYDKIPYNGNGTRTGLALKHVRDKSLSVKYGNRPDVQDVVLVITDGRAQDPKDVKKIARELRDDMGVLVYAVGIGLRDSVYKKLVKMTGDASRAINADSFDSLLAGGLAETFGKTLCHDPCST